MADFGEQTKKMDIALRYTDGNMDLAKNMIAGKYSDIYSIKGRVEILSSLYVLFILNVFHSKKTVMNCFVIASGSKKLDKVKAFLPLAQFGKEMSSLYENQNLDLTTINMVESGFRKNIIETTINDMVKACDGKDLESLTKLFNYIVGSSVNVSKVNCQMDIESISSYQWEISNVLGGIIPPMSMTEAAPEPEKKEDTEDDFMKSPEVQNIENKYEKVIDAGIVLSPARGLTITSLKAGDKIKIILPFSNDVEKDFAKARGAVSKDGQLKPIAAVFRKHVKMPDGQGHLIYADLPGRVLCRAFEESMVNVAFAEIPDRIKVQQLSAEANKKSGGNTGIIVGLGLLFLAIVAVVIAII